MRRRPLLQRILHAPVFLYRLGLGPLLGNRFLLLIHTGRRTGLKRQTVLEVMEYRKERSEAIVMSGFGRDSDWLRNIEATPNPEVIIGSQRFVASYHFLAEEEAAQVVKRYESRNRVAGWVVRIVLSRLLGWRYSGSEIDRHRLVQQLPLLAFCPRALPTAGSKRSSW